jgi:hypothetical protein
VIDDLTTHTDSGRQEMIHPYRTLYGRDLNQVRLVITLESSESPIIKIS